MKFRKEELHLPEQTKQRQKEKQRERNMLIGGVLLVGVFLGAGIWLLYRFQPQFIAPLLRENAESEESIEEEQDDAPPEATLPEEVLEPRFPGEDSHNAATTTGLQGNTSPDAPDNSDRAPEPEVPEPIEPTDLP